MHIQEKILSFILLMIKASFYNLLHVYLHIIPKRQFKGKREKNKECKYFAEAHPEGCDCCLDCHDEPAVVMSSLSQTLLTGLLRSFGNICPRRPRPVVFPEAQSFNYSGQLVDPGITVVLPVVTEPSSSRSAELQNTILLHRPLQVCAAEMSKSSWTVSCNSGASSCSWTSALLGFLYSIWRGRMYSQNKKTQKQIAHPQNTGQKKRLKVK